MKQQKQQKGSGICNMRQQKQQKGSRIGNMRQQKLAEAAKGIRLSKI